LAFDLFYQNELLANLTTNGYLKKDENELVMSFRIPERYTGVGRSLVSDLLDGVAISLEIQGNGTSRSLISRLTASYNYLYNDNDSMVSSFKDLGIDVRDISINKTDDTGMLGEVIAIITNPSIIETTLEGLEFSLFQNGTLLAEITPGGYLRNGENTVEFELFIPAEASAGYNTLATGIMNGASYEFTIRGSDSSGLPLSRLSTEFSYTYFLNVSEPVGATVTSLQVRPDLFNTDIDISALLSNPTPVTMNLANFRLSAYYQGSFLSDIALSDPWIIPGNQTVDLEMTVPTISLRNLGLLWKLLTNGEIDILIEGKHVFDGDNVIRFFLTTTINEIV